MLERLWRRGNTPAACGEEGTLLHNWWKCELVQPLWKTVWRFLKRQDYDMILQSQLMGMYLEKTLIQEDICVPMFIAQSYL